MKKTTYLFKGLGALALAFSAFALPSCLGDGDETMILESGSMLGIPKDADADPAPVVKEPTTTLPNALCTVVDENGHAVMNVDMTGVWHAGENDWMKLYGTAYKGHGQNVWVTVDGKPKGIDVYNNSEDEGRRILTDVVFLVDNSGSMSEEAEAIARDIKNWAEKLAKSGLDVRFGCVGYGDSRYAIDGALNVTTVDKLKEYLDADGRYGTNRTHYYGGSDAENLRSKAEGGNYENGSYNECGMVALHFANDNFVFRSGANRIYVNFTDEPNQPNHVGRWSVEFLNPTTNPNNWNPANGTVHTVYSGYKSSSWTNLYSENPALMSEYTGGTVLYATSGFTDINTGEAVTLESLPVTGAMQNSYIIRFTNIEEYMDGRPHEVKVTVVSADGTVKAEKIYYVVFTRSEE